MHSLITSVPRNGKAGWYESFRNHANLAVNSQKCRVLLIVDLIIANFSKFSFIFDQHFSKFNTHNLGIGETKIQNIPLHINNMSFVFMVWLTDERRLALFPAGNIVRDPHHLESPTRREQDLNLRRT